MKLNFLGMSIVVAIGFLFTSCSDNMPVQTTSGNDVNQKIAEASPYEFIANVTPVYATNPIMLISQSNIYIARRNGNNVDLRVKPISGGSWSSWGAFGNNLVQSDPAFCQSRVDQLFQAVIRESSGSLAHWWRSSSGTWTRQVTFGSNFTGSPSMVCNLMGDPQTQANLEVVARTSSGVQHIWRSVDGVWSTPVNLPMDNGFSVYSDPSIVQTSDYMAHVVAITKSSSTYYLTYWKKFGHDLTWTKVGNYSIGNSVTANERPMVVARNLSNIGVLGNIVATSAKYCRIYYLYNNGMASELILTYNTNNNTLGKFGAVGYNDGAHYWVHTSFYENTANKNHHGRFIRSDE